MFQAFHADIAKVDQDVAYVAMVVHVCCKRLFPIFHLCFRTYVTSVFIWMLHIFHIYVASVLSGFCLCVAMVFKRFSSVHLSSYICYKKDIGCCIWDAREKAGGGVSGLHAQSDGAG